MQELSWWQTYSSMNLRTFVSGQAMQTVWKTQRDILRRLDTQPLLMIALLPAYLGRFL
jgi:hypothetical protein